MSERLLMRLDGAALRANLEVARRHAAGAGVVAVVKADAYGHGAAFAARCLAGNADAFAVATVGEGVALRDLGIESPVWVLSDFDPATDMEAVVDRGLTVAVHDRTQLGAVRDAARPPGRVILKIDCGMGRLGFDPAELPAAVDVLRRCGIARILVMSHLANADDPADVTTIRQLQRFEDATAALGLELSLANSAGLLAFGAARFDWVRPGIMLYGASPLRNVAAKDVGLSPVMTLTTRILALRRFRRGQPVGYGGTWVCPFDSRVAILACGYGDGYPRQAPSGTPVRFAEGVGHLIGRVSMDSMAVDVTELGDIDPAQRPTLWGENLPVETVAESCQTIAYELLCRMGPRRANREIVDGST